MSHWPQLERLANTGRLYHDIADLIYRGPGFSGSIRLSRAVAVSVMNLVAQGIEAQRAATVKQGAVEDDSPVPKGFAQVKVQHD